MPGNNGAGALPAVLAFSTAEWGGIHNPVEPRLTGLARRGWPVLHSNGALSIWDRGSAAWNRSRWRGRIVADHGVYLDEPGRWPTRWQTWNRWDRFAVDLHARRLRRAAQRVGNGRVIAYFYDPRFYPYARALDPEYVIFQAIDNYAYQPGWTAEAAEQHAALVERADLLLANNPTQASLLPGSGPAKARVLPNAVDYERFVNATTLACPEDLARIPPPRIGYIGRLNPAVDFPAIEEVARARPDWNWVLIGPVFHADAGEYIDAEAALRACERLPNVHFLGYRDRSEVPAYLGHMQVNTICYRLSVGPWTSAAYPFKVLEALAVGLPVVSAPLPEVKRHSDVIDFADSPSQWLRTIERILAGGATGTPEGRQAIAQANSWTRRIDDLDGMLRGLLSRS